MGLFPQASSASPAREALAFQFKVDVACLRSLFPSRARQEAV